MTANQTRLPGPPGKMMAVASATLAAIFLAGCKESTPVTTYHYDNLRGGWNRDEEKLTYEKVSSSAFGQLYTVTLDDQVDAQPLFVPHQRIHGGPKPGKHDVVYVATEGNTVYAIEASDGTVLLSQNLGAPVATPLGCSNNGQNVGINGTPVIDLEDRTMYVMVYTLASGVPTYLLHALDLADLTDKVPAVTVVASYPLPNGTPFAFDATYQRQRSALLLSRGNVYAGFGSFCDFGGANSRGWILGWKARSLAPLAANFLTDRRLAQANDNFYLSSIWMSGYGISADGEGNIYFVTGNSGYNQTTYGADNIQESVVKMKHDLSKVLSVFTPSNVGQLDGGDTDFGSGGVLLLPEQSGPKPRLAAAAGKDGRMFLLDRDNLGGYSASGNNVVGQFSIGNCWCGQSYFAASRGYVVSSGGTTVNLWRIQESPSVTLLLEGTSAAIASGAQDPGFFSSVSSDEGKHPIIWAVSRPADPNPANIRLYAFKAQPQNGTLATLFQATAGTWPNTGGNANIVPVVAKGKVYVASNKELAVFGLH